MSDQDMAYRLRIWRKKIEQGRVFDAIDWLAQCELLLGARTAVNSLRHRRILTRACEMLWGETKALVARQQAVAA